MQGFRIFEDMNNKEYEKRLANDDPIVILAHAIFIVLYNLDNLLLDNNSPKVFVSHVDIFISAHKALLPKTSLSYFSKSQKIALDRYRKQKKSKKISEEHLVYLNNLNRINITLIVKERLSDCLNNFHTYWKVVLSEYIQFSAKINRLNYLIEQCDLFIQLAINYDDQEVLKKAHEIKKEFQSMIE